MVEDALYGSGRALANSSEEKFVSAQDKPVERASRQRESLKD